MVGSDNEGRVDDVWCFQAYVAHTAQGGKQPLSGEGCHSEIRLFTSRWILSGAEDSSPTYSEISDRRLHASLSILQMSVLTDIPVLYEVSKKNSHVNFPVSVFV